MFGPPRSGRSWCRFVILIMTGLAIWLYPILTMAGDDKISDPKSWADNFVRLVATRNMDDIISALTAASMGDRTPEFFTVQLAQVSELLPRIGEISSTDLIAEREWGKSVATYWYYLDFKDKVVIVSVRLGKHGSGLRWTPSFGQVSGWDKVEASAG